MDKSSPIERDIQHAERQLYALDLLNHLLKELSQRHASALNPDQPQIVHAVVFSMISCAIRRSARFMAFSSMMLALNSSFVVSMYIPPAAISFTAIQKSPVP